MKHPEVETISSWQDLWNQSIPEWRACVHDRLSAVVRQTGTRVISRYSEDDVVTRGEIEREQPQRPLTGTPVVVKDLFDMEGEISACSSALRSAPETGCAVPAVNTAPWVQRFIELGCIPVGRSQMNEFAYGIDGRNQFTGDCTHPQDPRRITGGSSSGSAWLVAHKSIPLTLGTDTGGSIRVPAAMCGIYGVRQRWDSSSLSGVFPLAPSMDCTGWFTGTAQEMRYVLKQVYPVTPTMDGKPKILWVTGHDVIPKLPVPMDATLEPGFQKLAESLSATPLETTDKACGEIRDLLSWIFGEGYTTYTSIGSYEAFHVHKLTIDRFPRYYDPHIWALIDRGRHISRTRYRGALGVRDEIRRALTHVLNHWDALVLPVTPGWTPTFKEADGDFRTTVLTLNSCASLAGFPALSIPISQTPGRSTGVQVIVPPGREGLFGDLISALE